MKARMLLRMAEIMIRQLDADTEQEGMQQEDYEYRHLTNQVQGEVMEVLHLAVAADLIGTEQLITFDEA
jgi:hypothetical protein